MIRKYVFGTPIETDAVAADFKAEDKNLFPLEHRSGENGETVIEFDMQPDDIVYGLGEAPRGINKRGWVYESFCTDEPFHTETKSSLYAAHNFIVLASKDDTFGLFIDTPARVRWDIGCTSVGKTTITVSGDFYAYVVNASSPLETVREFRRAIGESYIPPLWAFGFQQCRWSYENAAAVDEVIDGYNRAGIPLDCVYLDIDYMKDYKDFTVDPEKFPDFPEYVKSKKEQGIRLIPIIDAGVKKEDGYTVYEEGRDNGYFCKNEDGTNFEAGVWPGICCFPDFLRKDVREWFGSKYKLLTDAGIEGFWNDMNEPALFYSAKGLERVSEKISSMSGKQLVSDEYFEVLDEFTGLSNSMKDYESFYHTVGGKKVRHDKVHNIYGANMTRAAGEYFEKNFGSEKILMFSRASYIGVHRCSGIWFGDNHSWWSHILLNLKMLPSANMCGFLYCGADIGGFNENASRDLVLRFTAMGVFNPLMRNHSAKGTPNQESYLFENNSDFRDVIEVRYRLIPYLYNTFCSASRQSDMMYRPLGFDYPDDKIARECETQLMLGDECMIAPVYEQNATGRCVYLPEDMTLFILSGSSVKSRKLKKGVRYIDVALNEVPLFVKKGKKIPLCAPAMRTSLLNLDELEYLTG